jgi:sec-independent protein translocase protein TatA
MSPTLAFFTFSPAELLVLGFIALLLFGKRLPEVMRSLGKGVTEFKKGMSGLEDEFNRSVYGGPGQQQTYHEPGRPLPLEERPELTAPKFQPPTTAPMAAPPVVQASAPVQPQQPTNPV